jgi:cytochrome c oxidase subunit 3
MNGTDANGMQLLPLPVRAHPLVLGVVLVLASELMFFAALFAAYYDLRQTHTAWPPLGVHLDFVNSAAGTLLLFLASVTTVFATKAMGRGNYRAARRWIAAAIAAAAGFVAIALFGYTRAGFSIASNAYGTTYYTMTGFHLLHVLAGIGILIALFVGMGRPALTADRRAGAEAMTYYWHFVFVVWLGIWATIYFVR